MTKFVIPIWIFNKDQNLLTFSLFMCIGILPRIFFSAITGGLIDLFNQKNILLKSCLFVSGVLVLIILILMGILPPNLWFLGFLIFMISCFSNTIHIATLSYIPKLVLKNDLQQCNSLMIGAESSAIIITPLIAGFLVVSLDFALVVGIDLCLLCFSLVFLNRIKEIKRVERFAGFYQIIKDIVLNLGLGIKVIKSDPRLISLLVTIAIINFLFSLSFVAFIPLILSVTNNNVVLLGIINSIASIGQLFGALITALFLKATPKISLIYKSIILLGVFGPVLIGLKLSPLFWSAGYFLTLALLAIINITNQALWQSYSPSDLQGTIFGIRRMISAIIAPIGILLAPLTFDYILIPLQPSFLENKYQLIFIVTGISMTLVGVVGQYIFKNLNNISSLKVYE